MAYNFKAIDVDAARLLFSYDPINGTLCRIPAPRHVFKTENTYKRHHDALGLVTWRNLKWYGYPMIAVFKESYQAHRLAYAMHYGSIPPGMVVDHINGDRQDFRIENLRAVTHQQNLLNNKSRRAKSGGFVDVLQFSPSCRPAGMTG